MPRTKSTMTRVARLPGRLVRVANGLLLPSSRQAYLRRIKGVFSSPDACPVCGSPVKIATVMDRTKAARTNGARPVLDVRICGTCGHVGNPHNIRDYRTYEHIDQLPKRARIGTMDRQGREFFMAEMAVEILGRSDLDVLVFGAGRSLDNHHIARLPEVRDVAVGDVMHLRDDAPFVDITAPVTRRFDLVIASEVIEHFQDPKPEMAHLLEYVAPNGLLVCSTNIYDLGDLSHQHYVFLPGHTSYYSAESVSRLAEMSGFLIDFRTPLVATGYGGKRKRYVLMTQSAAVNESIAAYFATHVYAPSEEPWANRELAAEAVRPAV